MSFMPYFLPNKGPGSPFLILGYPGVIPLATSTPGKISWISFDLPLNEYYHFIGFILIFGWARWPMKTIYLWERLSDWTTHYNDSYRVSAADSKLFLANCPRGQCSERNHPWVSEDALFQSSKCLGISSNVWTNNTKTLWKQNQLLAYEH